MSHPRPRHLLKCSECFCWMRRGYCVSSEDRRLYCSFCFARAHPTIITPLSITAKHPISSPSSSSSSLSPTEDSDGESDEGASSFPLWHCTECRRCDFFTVHTCACQRYRMCTYCAQRKFWLKCDSCKRPIEFDVSIQFWFENTASIICKCCSTRQRLATLDLHLLSADTEKSRSLLRHLKNSRSIQEKMAQKAHSMFRHELEFQSSLSSSSSSWSIAASASDVIIPHH